MSGSVPVTGPVTASSADMNLFLPNGRLVYLDGVTRYVEGFVRRPSMTLPVDTEAIPRTSWPCGCLGRACNSSPG